MGASVESLRRSDDVIMPACCGKRARSCGIATCYSPVFSGNTELFEEGFARCRSMRWKSTETPAGAATAAIPRHIRELFGEPPLLRSESRDAYDALWSALAVQFDPREIMEWAWVRDLADLTWDVARIRRAMTSMLNISFKSGLRGTLRAVIPFVATLPPEPEVLAESWYDASSGKGQVAATLAKYGLGAEAAEGEAFARRLGDIERMQRLIISAESRRNMIMRELHGHRESALARRARNEIIDAEPADPRDRQRLTMQSDDGRSKA